MKIDRVDLELMALYENDEFYFDIKENDIEPHINGLHTNEKVLDRYNVAWYRCFDCDSVKPSFFMATFLLHNHGKCITCMSKEIDSDREMNDKAMRELGFNVGISGEVYISDLSPSTSLIVEKDNQFSLWCFYKMSCYRRGTTYKIYKENRLFSEVLFHVEGFISWLKIKKSKDRSKYYRTKHLQRKRF